MKFGNVPCLCRLLVLSILLVLLPGPKPCVLADDEEEQTCKADGSCTEEEKPASGCQNGHDQCEFWGSVGTWDGIMIILIIQP